MKRKLIEKAKQDCRIDWLPCVEDSSIEVVPLQITEMRSRPTVDELDTISDCRSRREVVQRSYCKPVGNIVPEDFFKEAAKQTASDNQKNIVAIIGHPGVGKTTLTKEILRKVLEHNLYEASFVFYLKFRDVDYESKTDLLTFLTADSITLEWKHKEHRRNAVLRKLMDEKVLIILDGLDEASLSYSNYKVNFDKKAKPGIIINNILSGQMFPKASKLITSRPRQLYELPRELLPKFILQISGIDEAAQRQLCRFICKERCDEVFSLVQDQPDLVSYCFIPVICTLVMHCIDHVHNIHAKRIPRTISSVFVYVFALFVGTRHLPNFAWPILKKYAKLAWDLFKKNKYYFDRSDLEKAEIKTNELNAFLVTILADGKLAMVKGDPTKRMYFTHLLWQELLVAMHFLFCCSTEALKNQLNQMAAATNFSKGKMEMIIKFLFGLCNCFCTDILQEKFLISPPIEHAQLLTEWAINGVDVFDFEGELNFRDESDSEDEPDAEMDFGKCRPLLTWAHEMSDDSFNHEISKRLPDKLCFDRNEIIHPMDIAVLHNFFSARKNLLKIKKGYAIVIDQPTFVGGSFRRFCKELAHASSIQVVEKVKKTH